MSNLKQSTLSFASTKRTNINAKKTSFTKRIEPAESPGSVVSSEILRIFSDEGSDAPEEVTVPTKRTRASTSGIVKKARSQYLRPESEKQKYSPAVVRREHLDVNDKAGQYHKYYAKVRSKMGHMEPIHSEGQNRIHQMLRFFDMSYEFGPCIGMTRLERWERAEAFGLDPPVEVRDILLTKEGTERAEYNLCVLHDEV